MGAGGVSPPPRPPPRAERRLRDVLLRRRWRRGFAVGGAFAENITLRGADMPVCGVQRFSAKTYGAAAFAARICRTRSARLLAASEPPLRRLLRRRRDSPPLPAHGRCRPVTPASLLFPRKEVKQEKRRLFQQKDSMSLRHKPSMRQKNGALAGRFSDFQIDLKKDRFLMFLPQNWHAMALPTQNPVPRFLGKSRGISSPMGKKRGSFSSVNQPSPNRESNHLPC